MTPPKADPWSVIGSAINPKFLPVLALCVLWGATAQGAAPIVAHIDSLWTSDQREAAIVLLEAELPLARAANDSALISTLLVTKGAYNNFLGNAQIAEAALLEAVAMARARRDSTLLMPAIRWLGRSIASQGRRDEARVFTLELLEVATLQGDRRHQGWANLGLAFGYWRRGESGLALEHYQNAAEQFVGTGEVQGELWAKNGIANANSNLGRYDEAAMGYLATIEAARAHQSTAAEAVALNNLGTLEYSLGRPDAALGHFRQAWDLQNQLRSTRQQLPTLFNISLCQADLGQGANARQTLDDALALCDQHGFQDMRSRTLVKIANMELQRNRLNRAENLIAEAMRDPATTMVKDVIAARSELGEAYRKRGDLAVAMMHFDEADSLLGDKVFPWVRLRLTGYRARALRDLGQYQQAQEQFLALAAEATSRSMPQYQMYALSEVAYTNLLRDQPDSALVFYLEAAATWESNRQQPLSPQWRERRGTNGQRIFADLALLLHEGGNPSEAFDRLQAYKSRTLLERMLGPGEALTTSLARRGDQHVGLSEVQNRLLAEDELLLDFTLGTHGSVLYAVTRDTLVMRRLPEIPVITARVRAYYDLLQDPAAGSISAIAVMGDGLAEMLLSDLPEVFVHQTRFLVAPDGVLNLLPFADLDIRAQGPDWTRVPSASILLKLRDEGPRHHEGPWHTLAVASNWGLENATLSGTMLEVERLNQNYKNVQSQILSGDEMALPSLGGYDVLHLAAHASNDDQSPWQSAIHFLPEEQGGNLRATDVLDLDLNAGLAVLSSCSSGTGEIINGEGVLGLSTAFLGAGVPAILASLWAVDDGATAQFMAYFYGFLAEGDDCARALTNTQRELRKHPDTSHPYYWAGFVLVGDGSIQPHLVPKRKRPGPVLLATVAMGFLIPVMLLRGRRAKGPQVG